MSVSLLTITTQGALVACLACSCHHLLNGGRYFANPARPLADDGSTQRGRRHHRRQRKNVSSIPAARMPSQSTTVNS